MKGLTLHFMPGFERQSHELGALLNVPAQPVEIHHFPDQESLVTVRPTTNTAAVFCSLDRPNRKLVELMLTASALRDRGATRLLLIAPYMCYMRQDTTFESGQAVSQRVVAKFLSSLFDKIVTVDPHLHRRHSISDAFPETEAVALSAAPLLASFLKRNGEAQNPILIGPDVESRQWVEAVADPLGLDVLTAQKTRRGDAEVEISIPGVERVAGRSTIIVDDVVSTGVTIARCAELLTSAGATVCYALAVHCLCDENALTMMLRSGIQKLRTTDSIAHSTNAIALTPLLARALKEGIRA